MLLSRVRWRLLGVCLRAAQSVPSTASLCASSTEAESDPGWRNEGEQEPERQQRLLRAAILGLPNAGKSTLVNQLLGRKLFAVSPKRHTTTRSAAGVFTEGNSQVILMDTPGVVPYQVGRKLKAPKSFLTGPHRSLMEAELVVVVVDASDKRTRERLNPQLMQTLSRYSHVPAVLLLNKVDAVRQKHVLLNITEGITEAAKKCVQEQERKGSEENSQRTQNVHTSAEEATVYCRKEETKMGAVESFREVFMVSALTGDGIEDLRDYLLSCARPGQWEYSVTEHSDQSQMALAEDIIREKLFLHLHREIPYVLTQGNVVWEREGDTQIIYQNLTCRSSSQASVVIGPGGSTIQTITAEAQTDIEAVLGCPVNLTLNVRSQTK